MTKPPACRCVVEHPTTDLDSAPFEADLYGHIDELRAQCFAARTPKGHVFFNQEDASYVLRCEDFRFAFHQIDSESSPYLAEAIEHELLNMHGAAHRAGEEDPERRVARTSCRIAARTDQNRQR